MGQPHKGDRKLVQSRVPKVVDIDSIAHAAGYRYSSQYVADVLCRVHGFPELMLGPDHPGQDQLTA